MLGLELGRRARLDLEAGARLRLAGELRLDELDGDARPERLVDALPHRPHAARTDEALNAVLARDELPLAGTGCRRWARRRSSGLVWEAYRIAGGLGQPSAGDTSYACSRDAPTHAPDARPHGPGPRLVHRLRRPAEQGGSTGSGRAAASARPPRPPPEPPRAPDIVIDASNVAVGSDRVAGGELGLADKVGRLPQGAADDRGQHGQRRRHAERQAFAGRGRGLRAAQGQGERRRPQDRGARRDDAVDAGVFPGQRRRLRRRPPGSRRTRRSRSGPRAAARPSAS